MVTFQEGSKVTSAEDDLTDRLQEMISQACCNHGLIREYSLYPRKRLVSYTVILVFGTTISSFRAVCGPP